MQSKIVNLFLTLFYIFVIGCVVFFVYFMKNMNRDFIDIEKIQITESEVYLRYGEVSKLNAEIFPENASKKEVKWLSSNNNIVSVDEEGNIIAVGNQGGEVIITATAANGEKTSSVKVLAYGENTNNENTKVEALSISQENLSIKYGETAKINTNIYPLNAANKDLKWSSSNSNLVQVDDKGNITTSNNLNGSAIVTVTTNDGSHSASIEVKVEKKKNVTKVKGVKLNKNFINLEYGKTAKINATISPSNATNKGIIWTSSNKRLVSVDAYGNVKAIGNITGDSTITAKTADGNHIATAKVHVTKVPVKVRGIKLNKTTDTVYLNSPNRTVNLAATIFPLDAEEKGIIWTSSNTNIATVNNGKVIANYPGTSTITATTVDGNYKASYKLIVKQKNIIVITASNGVRMNKWYKEYVSPSNDYYSIDRGTLKYIYKSGSGFEYQYGEGLNLAKKYLNSNYSKEKDYIELNVFFTLTGNSVKKMTCENVNTSDEYYNIANKYNNAVQEIKDLGYKNVKVYIISHSPLNTKHPLANKSSIVFSHKKQACESGYRSAWKYYLSNQRMKKVIGTGKYVNIRFIDNYSNFVIIKDESQRTFTWIRNFSTPQDDALHWDEPTTKMFMQLVFETAGI